MNLKNLAYQVLNEASIEQLQTQFVDSGKISSEDFESIKQASGGKGAYATWLAKKIEDKTLKAEDLYKWEEYFKIFNRRKKDFPSPDINSYKSVSDINSFIRKAVELKNKEQEDPSAKKGVSKVDKFEEFKIGEVDGFMVYEIPKGREDLYNTSCELGKGTEWCTATGKTREYFDNYIDDGSLFIFRKPGSDEKYEFHYENNEFMDKNNLPVI